MLVKMRVREGAHLRRDLISRIALMRRAVAQIHKQAPMVQERYREQLRQRIKNAGLPEPATDDERLLKEIVYFADFARISPRN